MRFTNKTTAEHVKKTNNEFKNRSRTCMGFDPYLIFKNLEDKKETGDV